MCSCLFFFFNDTATTEIYTLSLHDALPICDNGSGMHCHQSLWKDGSPLFAGDGYAGLSEMARFYIGDRKSTRLNSSHANISYAVFCLKKKKKHYNMSITS